MKGKIFIDSNIFLYYLDSEDLIKKQKVHDILDSKPNHQIVISTQVIKEVANILLRKYDIDPLKVKLMITLLNEYELVDTDLTFVSKALDICKLYKFSFWDSLIVACALISKCNYLFTEDLQHNQKIEGLQIINPFIS